MSQNITQTTSPTGPVQVIVGWDRQLQELFCTVLPLSDEDEGDYFAFFGADFSDMTSIQAALETSRISVPSTLFEAASLDKAQNAGNVMRTFTPTGELVQDHAFA